MSDIGRDAAWRTSRLSHNDVICRMLAKGKTVSPFFSIPYVIIEICRIDWLHCCDQGVAADYLANLFIALRDKCPGRSMEVRTQALWEKICAFYSANKVEDRLPTLTTGMLVQPAKAPKLRCSAARCRALVPFAAECSQELLSSADPLELAAKAGAHHLHMCYKALSLQESQIDIMDQSIRFARQYVSLFRAMPENSRAWRIKPKLHMFLELCAEEGKPSMSWCYRDEDFGGSVARLSQRRGGILSVKAFSTNLLERFQLQQPIIRMTC